MRALRRRLERVSQDLEGPGLTMAEACTLCEKLAGAVRRHVTDVNTLRAIAADMRQLAVSVGERRR